MEILKEKEFGRGISGQILVDQNGQRFFAVWRYGVRLLALKKIA